MTDDLVKIIRWYIAHNERIMPEHAKAAADRIEKLEAALRGLVVTLNSNEIPYMVRNRYASAVAEQVLEGKDE